MGVAYYVEANKTIPNFDVSKEIIGKAIAHADDGFKKIYKKLKVKPIIEFFGQDQSEFSDEIEATNKEDLPWFDPEEGIITINALICYLNENPTALKNIDNVKQDLIESKKVLDECKKAGAKWHLALDI
jgi:hypothetical protein